MLLQKGDHKVMSYESFHIAVLSFITHHLHMSCWIHFTEWHRASNASYILYSHYFFFMGMMTNYICAIMNVRVSQKCVEFFE